MIFFLPSMFGKCGGSHRPLSYQERLKNDPNAIDFDRKVVHSYAYIEDVEKLGKVKVCRAKEAYQPFRCSDAKGHCNFIKQISRHVTLCLCGMSPKEIESLEKKLKE